MSTYTPIATQTLTSNQANIDFTSIPENYTDLRIIFNGALATGDTLSFQFNSDTGSNYSYTRIIANGSAYSSYRESSITIGKTGPVVSTSITTPTTITTDIMNYSNSGTYKTTLSKTADQTYTAVYATLWKNTNSINSIRIRVDSGVNILSGSTVSLYGISYGNSLAKASGGNIVTTDGTYWYHAFTASGSFIPKESLTADILIVGGAGGGGAGHGGGGGAGGVLAYSSQSLSSETAYSCVIGSGGAGGTRGYSRTGFKGNPSKFSSLSSSLGGGGGGSYNNAESSSGASGGGGGGGKDYTSGSAGTQGYAGGNGTTNGTAGNGGGGGGAGGIGGNASGAQGSGSGGVGGNGINSVTNWGSLSNVLNSIKIGVSGYIAGGGGGGGWQTPGGVGGSGGGGAGYGYGSGSNTQTGYPGIANTGSGGGGGPDYNNGGGSGASGLIIIRYAV